MYRRLAIVADNFQMAVAEAQDRRLRMDDWFYVRGVRDVRGIAGGQMAARTTGGLSDGQQDAISVMTRAGFTWAPPPEERGLPDLFAELAFVEIRRTDGIRRRMEVRLPHPVPQQDRRGPAQIAGIPGHWSPDGDLIILDPPVTPEMAEAIADMCRESVQRGRGAVPPPEMRIRPLNWVDPLNDSALGRVDLGATNAYLDLRLREAPRVYYNDVVRKPPSAPRCACGERSNSRWEHHSGGCTYLDPNVTDYYNEPPEPDDED